MASEFLHGLDGPCPPPFLRQPGYPETGGFIDGRTCMPIPELNATCCIPCPVADWFYDDGFQGRSQAANWMNLAAACATLFLLLSFVVLDVKWTHRHYLSVCLTIGVLFMELAFIVPLMARPEQCYNDITPHGMHSDTACALSGSLLLFGGWSAVIWVFWRAFSIHLQICWQVIPGQKFFYSALTIGWGIPIAGLATALSLTGVSYRFGDVCHINHRLGLQDFWGPLLFFTALSMVLQFTTIGYCIQVFIKSLLDEGRNNSNSTNGRPSTQNSFRADTARQAYRRVKRVVELQWRGAMIVLVILGEVVFFSIVFVSIDNNSQINEALKEKAMEWIICLVTTQGDKTRCLPYTAKFVPPQSEVLAVLICLALSGFWLLLFFGRWSMVLGWQDLFRRKFSKDKETSSTVIQQHRGSDPREYEMLESSHAQQTSLKGPFYTQTAPSLSTVHVQTPTSADGKQSVDYFADVLPTTTPKYTTPRLTSPTSPMSPISTFQDWEPTSEPGRKASLVSFPSPDDLQSRR